VNGKNLTEAHIMDTTLEETLTAKVRTLTPTQQRYVLSIVESLGPTVTPPGISGPEALQFVGLFSKEDADEMMRVIEEDCERIDPDGW